MTRFALLALIGKAGVPHAFVEDCPCGGCEDFFAFGRAGRGGSLWIAFSTDRAPLEFWREGEAPLSLAHVSEELREVLRKVRDVLEVSDPEPGRPTPVTHLSARAPEAPSAGLAARVLARISAAKRKPRLASKRLVFKGESLLVSEWSERTGIDRASIYWRLSQGWMVRDVLTTPVKKRRSA